MVVQIIEWELCSVLSYNSQIMEWEFYSILFYSIPLFSIPFRSILLCYAHFKLSKHALNVKIVEESEGVPRVTTSKWPRRPRDLDTTSQPKNNRHMRWSIYLLSFIVKMMFVKVLARKDLVFKHVYCNPPLFLANLLGARFKVSIQLQCQNFQVTWSLRERNLMEE